MTLQPTREEWLAARERLVGFPITATQLDQITTAALGPCPPEPPPEGWHAGFAGARSCSGTVHQRVRRFHELCDIPNADKPGQITPERRALRVRLLCEEFCEVLAELMPSKHARAWIEDLRREVTEDCGAYCRGRDVVNLAALAKELADLEVVTVGCAAEFGLPHDQVADLVMDSNDAKANGPTREDGKKLKPEGWQAPDVAGLLESGARP